MGHNLSDASEDVRAHPWKLANKPEEKEIAFENLRNAAQQLRARLRADAGDDRRPEGARERAPTSAPTPQQAHAQGGARAPPDRPREVRGRRDPLHGPPAHARDRRPRRAARGDGTPSPRARRDRSRARGAGARRLGAARRPGSRRAVRAAVSYPPADRASGPRAREDFPMRKVAVIGGGNVGATAAWQIASRDVADVALYDILPGVPAGKALDMTQAGPVFHFDARVEGSDDIEVIRGRRGRGRDRGLPAQARHGPHGPAQEERRDRARRRRSASSSTRPDAVVVVITNPLDVMTWVVKTVTGFPKERVVGMAGVLDCARFATFVADGAQVLAEGRAPHDPRRPRRHDGAARALQHGERRPALRADARRDARSASPTAPATAAPRSSSSSAPAAPTTRPPRAPTLMVEAILGDTGRIVPAAPTSTGEYGFYGHLPRRARGARQGRRAPRDPAPPRRRREGRARQERRERAAPASPRRSRCS